MTKDEIIFQSTPPARGATPAAPGTHHPFRISIHAPREGGDVGQLGLVRLKGISIHAPREGGDYDSPYERAEKNISIHAPREGGDMRWTASPAPASIFQSTPPARGATGHIRHHMVILVISIHAPREGGDSKDAQFYLRIFDK